MKIPAILSTVFSTFLFCSCVDKAQLTQYTPDEFSKARLTADNAVQLILHHDPQNLYGLYNENFRKAMPLQSFLTQYEKTMGPYFGLKSAVYRDFRIGAKYYFGKLGLKRAFIFTYRTRGTVPGTVLNIEIASDTNYRALAGIFFTLATNAR